MIENTVKELEMNNIHSVLLLAGLTATAHAGWVDLGGGPNPRPPEITLLQDNAQGCSYHVTVYGFELDTIAAQGGNYTLLSLPVTPDRMEKGNPQLPELDIRTIVPDNGAVYCQITDLDTARFDILPVVSSKGCLPRNVDPDTIPYTFNQIYFDSLWFPDSTSELSAPFGLCDYRGVNARLNLFTHNPTLGKLRVIKGCDVVLTYQNAQLAIPTTIASDFTGVYQSFFGNFSPIHFVNVRQMKMTIITADQFYDDVLPLRDWKMRKGVFVEDVKKLSDITDPSAPDTAAIKQYIHDQWSNCGVTYFLLVGDYAHIPSYEYPDLFPPHELDAADPIYVLLSSENDQYPDAYIARISGANDQEITNQIDKLIHYEGQIATSPSNPYWTTVALVVASQETGLTRVADTTHKRYLENMLQQRCGSAVNLWDNQASPPAVSAELNYGRGFVNFFGDGNWEAWGFDSPYIWPVFDIDRVQALQNSQMTPVVISVACLVGDFMHNPGCFAEAWLRQGSLDGAVGFYGASAPLTWVPPEFADSVAVQSLTEGQFLTEDFPNTLGEALYTGGIDIIGSYPVEGFYDFVIWHIFGDASTQVRMGEQLGLSCSYGAPFPGRPFPVSVTEGAPPGTPCSRAVVCLWKEDDNYWTYQLTGDDGCTTFLIPGWLTRGTLVVTATKYDHTSYEDSIPVPAPPPGGGQANPGEIYAFTNLSVSPSISGGAFRIRIPYYALSLEIYDGAGALVNSATAKGEITWNGVDRHGRPLPEGVYFIRARGNKRTEVKQVLLLR
jgi:hypothetical protein